MTKKWMKKFISTLCYESFKATYYKMRHGDLRSVVVTRPKGCGKTTRAKKLHKQLLSDGVKVAFCDVSEVQKETLQSMLHELCQTKKILVDKAAGEKYCDMVRFIAAFSPGAKTGSRYMYSKKHVEMV